MGVWVILVRALVARRHLCAVGSSAGGGSNTARWVSVLALDDPRRCSWGVLACLGLVPVQPTHTLSLFFMYDVSHELVKSKLQITQSSKIVAHGSRKCWYFCRLRGAAVAEAYRTNQRWVIRMWVTFGLAGRAGIEGARGQGGM